MRLDEVRALYRYNEWATNRILDKAAELTAEQFTTVSLGICNLHETLVHLMGAEVIWRMRWMGIDPQSVEFEVEGFPTLELIRARWQAETRELYAYFDSLTEADLDKPLTYARGDGQTYTRTLWHLFIHLFNHGTQHRSELALLLTNLGHSPGDIDFNIFARATGL